MNTSASLPTTAGQETASPACTLPNSPSPIGTTASSPAAHAPLQPPNHTRPNRDRHPVSLRRDPPSRPSPQTSPTEHNASSRPYAKKHPTNSPTYPRPAPAVTPPTTRRAHHAPPPLQPSHHPRSTQPHHPCSTAQPTIRQNRTLGLHILTLSTQTTSPKSPFSPPPRVASLHVYLSY